MDKMTLGGQAVIEGVLIRSPHYYTIAVRKPNNKISVIRKKLDYSRNKFTKLFLIRGMVALWETLSIGFNGLMHSSDEASEEGEKLGKNEMAITVGFSIAFALLLFVGLPFFLSTLVTKDHNSLMFNIVDGILRMGVFLAYLIAISFLPDVKTMFQYHGAEHMSIHAFESGKKFSVPEVRKFETMHPRCGTSFLLFVMMISIIVFSIVTSENIIIKVLSRILLIPVIAGLSYEVLKASAKHRKNFLIGAIVYPGILLQKITTKRPTDKQIQVAMAAVKEAILAEKTK